MGFDLGRFLLHRYRHIQEEFEDLFTEEDLKAMNHDELAFTWLRYVRTSMGAMP